MQCQSVSYESKISFLVYNLSVFVCVLIQVRSVAQHKFVLDDIHIRVAQNPENVTHLFSNLFMGIFVYQGIGKYKQQIHRIYIGFAQSTCFPTKKYKRFQTFIKGIICICFFQFLCFLTFFIPKLNQ